MISGRPARTIHCGGCGGALEKGRPTCPYCGRLIDPLDARLTAYCEACLAMSPEGASFCCECGKPLGRAAEARSAESALCPRCRAPMRQREVGGHRPLECPMCLGLFVGADEIEAMIRDQEGRVAGADPAAGPKRSEFEPEPVTYLRCPVCGTAMNRVNYGRSSGVLVDVCRRHGTWLDAGELQKIAAFVATGGLKRAYQAEIEDLKAERDRLSAAALSQPALGAADPADTSFFGGNPGPIDLASAIVEVVDAVMSFFRERFGR